MLKKYLFYFNLIFTTLVFSQSQFGITSGVNITSTKSQDLIGVQSSAGLGIGLTALFPFHKTSDWVLGLSYKIKGISIEGYKGFYNQEQLLSSDGKLKIESLDLDFIINQYIIMPKDKTFHLGI